VTIPTTFGPESIIPGFVAADVQIGCVVADLQAAARLWSAMLGIGPWIVLDGFPGFKVHWQGRSADVGIEVAFTYYGDLQVELIAPLPGTASPYREFVDAGGDGFHHFGLLAHDIAAALDAAKAAGLKPAFELAVPGSDSRTIYFQAPPGMGCLVEIVDFSPNRRRAFDAIKAATRDWDGSDAFRRYPSMGEFVASAA
jgi:catechol 2,3-dioxygenase-like lactoylglutathione lyase family enzyme